MTEAREASKKVKFIDDYSKLYAKIFEGDVRSFEYFRDIQIGLLSEIKRKSLPEIAKVVGLGDGQELHHFIAESPWKVDNLRERRLEITKELLKDQKIKIGVDETGDKKKGSTIDYVARQYIGNIGKVEQGIVSVNIYAIIDDITIPLLFQVYKPKSRLKLIKVKDKEEKEPYLTKPQIAIELIKEIVSKGFNIELVVGDSIYGESRYFVSELEKLKLNYILATHSNHSVEIEEGKKLSYTTFTKYERKLADGKIEIRFIREVIYGQRKSNRYFQVCNEPLLFPDDSSYYFLTNLNGNIKKIVGNLYGFRTWIEYAFRQSKFQLGWNHFRFTHYSNIERWWELCFVAYLLVSCHSSFLVSRLLSIYQNQSISFTSNDSVTKDILASSISFTDHPSWKVSNSWINTLHNLRLIIQPIISLSLLTAWIKIFHISELVIGFDKLLSFMNYFSLIHLL